MSTFNQYAEYYDLLYKDKDYTQEANYIDSLLQKYLSNPKTILELGCGTGKHAIILGKKGYKVHGVDLSEGMIREAKIHLEQEESTDIQLTQGDIRKVRLEEKFDAVISLFHVMSYQTKNEDLVDVFKTVSEHLNEGGLFIFDCWNGPAVLAEQPETRVKRLENDAVEITRIAEPILHPNENAVDVNYEIYIMDKKNNQITKFSEIHKMRYLFKTELVWLASQYGFTFESMFSFHSFNTSKLHDWNVIYILRKR